MDRVLSERYELQRHVARGGMADIYLGRDRRLGREVAVKVLRPELSADDEYIDRFRDEARAAAQLNHPNIVSVFDWGSDGGDAYIVMEWVDGPTLAEVLRADAPLPVDRAARIGADIAGALAYAHAKGVIHRDVKPSNVLLAPTGHAKVADFGIAKVPERSAVETNPGVVLGTPAYLSPEQLRGGSADPRSDVYGLGAVLYEMVTAHKPFAGDTPAEVAGNVLHHRPPRPSGINPEVPAPFEGILSKALAREPEDRYRDANELRVDLLEFADGAGPAVAGDATTAFAADPPVDATRPMTVATEPAVVVAGPPPRRKRTAEAWLIGVILALAVLAVIIALVASNSGGGGDKVTVPAVTNLPQNDAIARLQRANLNPVPTPQNDPTVKAGNVIATDPPAGTKVKKNSDVKLLVSEGPTTTTRRVPTTRPTVTVPATTSPPTTEPTTTPTTSSTPTTSGAITTITVGP